MKLRLFALRDTQTKKLVPGAYFVTKSEAKCARDELNKGTTLYVVTLGPDHQKSRR